MQKLCLVNCLYFEVYFGRHLPHLSAKKADPDHHPDSNQTHKSLQKKKQLLAFLPTAAPNLAVPQDSQIFDWADLEIRLNLADCSKSHLLQSNQDRRPHPYLPTRYFPSLFDHLQNFPTSGCRLISLPHFEILD